MIRQTKNYDLFDFSNKINISEKILNNFKKSKNIQPVSVIFDENTSRQKFLDGETIAHISKNLNLPINFTILKNKPIVKSSKIIHF